MTNGGRPPKDDEFELTLLGPGYGESIVLHIGDGAWVIVDSCGREDAPAALDYLENIGVDPCRAVAMIVATHWHDDHIRGLAQMLHVCSNASFCCAGVLCNEEFLARAHALEGRHHADFGSGLREMNRVFRKLADVQLTPTPAFANRRVFAKGPCHIWSLSPADDLYADFLGALSRLLPQAGQPETRIRSLSPNEVAVVLLVEVSDIAVLLGSDLERNGWLKIVQDPVRPSGPASAFKVPHHGSDSADEPRIWRELLDSDPVAVLTPWRRGDRVLPSDDDARRILTKTETAYATARADVAGPARRASVVERTIKQSGIRLRRSPKLGFVRLRRRIGSRAGWQVETLGSACHLKEYVQERP